MKNNVLNLSKSSLLRIIFIDFVAVALVLFLPAFSHMLPFPLFYLDPMRLVLLGVYFVTRNEKNAMIIGTSLPIFSMLYSGHPIFYKAILISLELLINIVLLNVLVRKGINIFFAVLFSILISKVVYYLFKYYFIEWSLISGKLFSTSLTIQILIALGLSAIFYMFKMKTSKNPNV